MKTATFLKVLEWSNGRGELFRMDPPHEGHEFVAVSAVNYPIDRDSPMACLELLAGLWMGVTSRPNRIHETYLFASNSKGKVSDWMDLKGSQKKTTDIDRVLRDAGYTVVRPS